MSTAYLGLGSNLGDRLKTLGDAVRQLGDGSELRVKQISSVYETAPVGVTAQPDFLNIVAEVETSLSPRELLDRCLRIEADLGRVRRERWGPRTIDIDVLWYDGLMLREPDLELPHPRMPERGFVMVPLAEIAPRLVIAGETASMVAARLGSAGLRSVGRMAAAGESP